MSKNPLPRTYLSRSNKSSCLGSRRRNMCRNQAKLLPILLAPMGEFASRSRQARRCSCRCSLLGTGRTHTIQRRHHRKETLPYLATAAVTKWNMFVRLNNGLGAPKQNWPRKIFFAAGAFWRVTNLHLTGDFSCVRLLRES